MPCNSSIIKTVKVTGLLSSFDPFFQYVSDAHDISPGISLTGEQHTFKRRVLNWCQALATPAIFYSHWQLDILKAVLRQKSKAVASVAMCPQYLQHVPKSSIR